jgi:toxin ParE1/3/4
MEWRYRLTRRAEQDFYDISEYWTGQAGEEVGLDIVISILRTILMLSMQQRAGKLVEEFGPDVRRFPSGNHLIYYRILKGDVHVVRVLHGARDQRKAWAE